MRPQAVIFDIGNVLLEWNPERAYVAAFGADRTAAVFAAVDLHAMNLSIDAGAPFRQTVYGTADRHPDWAIEVRFWHDHWIEMAGVRIAGSIATLRALKAKGVAVFALTNFGVDSFAFAQGQIDVLREFDYAYVSGHMGVVKPDPVIYAMVEEHSGLPPGALLFTDDKAENVEAAAARGWQVHHFTEWQAWARCLVGTGLLTETEAGL